MMMMSLDGAKVRFYHVTLISNSYTMGCPPVCGDDNNMFDWAHTLVQGHFILRYTIN